MLKEALEVVELHFKRAKSNVCEIQKWQDISSNDFADDNKVRVIDAFIYRFIKLQDLRVACKKSKLANYSSRGQANG